MIINNNSLLTYFRQVAIYKLKVQILKYPRFKTLKKERNTINMCTKTKYFYIHV